MALYTGYAGQYGSTVLAGPENLNLQLNSEVDNRVGIGSIYPQFVVLRGQRPVIPFQTHAIANLLAITGLVGADIDDTNNFVATFAKMANQLPEAGSVHRSYTCDRGVLVPRRLSCQHQQDAIIDAEAVLFSSDGATEPLVISDAAALPTLPRDNVRHTLAKAVIAGENFGCQVGVTIEFGNNVQTRGCNSDVWDKHIEQPGVQPVIRLTGIDAEQFSDAKIPVKGKEAPRVSTKLFFRKYDESGILFVADDLAPAANEHVKIDAEGVVVVTEHTSSGSDTSELTVEITCSLDAIGNAPIGIDTASAIT